MATQAQRIEALENNITSIGADLKMLVSSLSNGAGNITPSVPDPAATKKAQPQTIQSVSAPHDQNPAAYVTEDGHFVMVPVPINAASTKRSSSGKSFVLGTCGGVFTTDEGRKYRVNAAVTRGVS